MKISFKRQVFYLALATICLISLSGAIVYRVYALNWLGIIAALILAAVGFYFFSKLFDKKTSSGQTDIESNFISTKARLNWKKLIIIFAYLAFFTGALIILFSARTGQALTSPWQAIPSSFFIFYILATVALFFLIQKKLKSSLFFICLHYFISFSILWIVFKIGYGYDPFIHQATVNLIDKQGLVDPKPFYYLGQYSLILAAHKLFFIPIVWLDKLLVPILAALTLPPTIYLFLKKYFQNSSFIINHLSLIILLILPFSLFTLTVPQNLAYLFLILAILFSLLASTKVETVLSYLLIFSALATHLIAGIPALLFVIALSIYHSSLKTKIKNIFYALILIFNASALPILFWLTQKNNISAGASDATANSNFSLPAIIFPQRENIFLNFVYFFQSNLWLILILISALAIYAVYRYRRQYPVLIFSANFSLTLLLAYWLTSRINFSFLISYERDDYANRIITIAFIFLLPIIALLFCKLLNRIMNCKSWLKYSWLIFLLFLITASLYGSYPRRDNYFNSHGFAVGQNDLAAVNWVEQDAKGTPYVVLANQQVSVGALWTFGFGHYLKNGLYFYPIPTGGPLYQIYLDMVYKNADRATALKAADLTGVPTVYFILNKYWTDFDKIVEQAKIGATSYENLSNGEIYIFKYLK